MAPRKRVGRATPQTSLTTPAVNICGFPALAALADEIYLEILSHIASVPIPTPIALLCHPEIRRSRHETLLSLSQTCRSLRRVFLRYLVWQRIEVCEGMKVGHGKGTLIHPSIVWDSHAHKKLLKAYTFELFRQLKIVTVHNPQLAQHVNYIDVFIGECSCNRVLAELARCLSLFSNLHTIQIDVFWGSKRVGNLFERAFKKYSYPQIRNVFVMPLSESLLGSCPEARRIGLTRNWTMSSSFLRRIVDNCPHLEALDTGLTCRNDTYKFVVEHFPNLRHITIHPSRVIEHNFPIDILTKLNHLQSITLIWNLPPMAHILNFREGYGISELLDSAKEAWMDRAKRSLIGVQLRDKLEKFLTVVIETSEAVASGREVTQTITLKPFEDSREALALVSRLSYSS
ncbi:hypothetical protein BYT27DRAFT_7181450 [Phlegmacium glaucopus]|nr:hypothetical protein BYT27DRAFT_7181450 [Phlegmacium glaucopus]